MNQQDTLTFNQALQLAQSGQKEKAYDQLAALFRSNDNQQDSGLLLWLAFTAPTLTEAEQFVTKLERNDSANPNLASAKNWIISEKTKQAKPGNTSSFGSTLRPSLETTLSSNQALDVSPIPNSVPIAPSTGLAYLRMVKRVRHYQP